MLEIPRPCKKEVEKYLKRWDSLENYVLQESSLNKLFFNSFNRLFNSSGMLSPSEA